MFIDSNTLETHPSLDMLSKNVKKYYSYVLSNLINVLFSVSYKIFPILVQF